MTRERLAARLDRLAKRYPDGTEALRGVSLEVRRGEAFALLGRNGSGKTTSVRIMVGLTQPTSGRVEVLGADVVEQRRQVQRRIGVTLQEAAIDEVLTGRELLILVGRFWGMGRAAARCRADELVELFGLSEAAERRIGTYSGGMKRRLDISASLVRLPEMLFLDEPTTGLDPQNRRALWAEIVRLRREHRITVLLTTQYLEEAEALANRIAILDRGRLVACGTAEELRRAHGSIHVRLRLAGADRERALELLGPTAAIDDEEVTVAIDDGVEAVAIVNRLEAAGVEVLDVDIHRDSLEHVFLDLTGAEVGGGAAAEAAEPVAVGS